MNDEPREESADVVGPLPEPKRPRSFVPLAILILLSGIIIGAAAGVQLTRRKMLDRFRHPRRGSVRFISRVTEDLALTPEQKEQVEAVVSRHTENLHRIRSETLPRMREEFGAMREEITALLDEQQAEAFREHFERWERSIPSPNGTREGGEKSDGRRRGSRSSWRERDRDDSSGPE